MTARDVPALPPAGRPLTGVEAMARDADEAYTMSFTTSALVEGPISTSALRHALDALAARHPLLGAAIEDDRFQFGRAAPIELVERQAPLASIDASLEDSLQHQRWAPRGPRARCVCTHHGDGLATIALTFDHRVSDGGSGVIALRDLLTVLGGDHLPDAPLDSPGQEHFLPPGRGGVRDFVRAVVHQAAAGARPRPFRLGEGPAVPPETRRTRIHRIRLGRTESLAVTRAAKAAGATVHGVVVGAVAHALAEMAGEARGVPLRIMHPVDMRRVIAAVVGEDRIGDAVGYYVSAVETEHHVTPGSGLATLAHEVTAAVRSAKERGEPFLSAPSAGKLLVLARKLLGARRFREVGERELFVSSFSFTNLGALERLGMTTRFGRLRVLEVSFLASPSVFGASCMSASSFDGALEVVLHHVEPRIDAATGAQLADRVEATLQGLGASEDAG